MELTLQFNAIIFSFNFKLNNDDNDDAVNWKRDGIYKQFEIKIIRL